MQRHFPGQRDHEQIFTVIHRHWFNILSHFIVILLLLFFTLAFFFLAPVVALWTEVAISMPLVSFITTTMLLFLWLYGFFVWIDYYFDVWVITDERILNIEQKGLFSRAISEVNLGRIQDVTTEVRGFIPTLLNYGHIFVQTAGEEKRFHFRNVGMPDTHKDRIMDVAKAYQAKEGGHFSTGGRM